jgi:hypothetical protein
MARLIKIQEVHWLPRKWRRVAMSRPVGMGKPSGTIVQRTVIDSAPGSLGILL